MEDVINNDCTTEEEEKCLAQMYPWQCWSKGNTQSEEFRSLEEMAKAKSMTVEAVMDAIANNQGNLDGMRFVKHP